MKANWRVNVLLGFPAFLFTYFFSYVNNTWQISLFRATIGFILFFMVGYIVRYILHQIALKNDSSSNKKHHQNIEIESSQAVEGDNQVEKGQMVDSSFQTIPLHSLHNGASVENPENKAQIIRAWTSQNQEG